MAAQHKCRDYKISSDKDSGALAPRPPKLGGGLLCLASLASPQFGGPGGATTILFLNINS